MKRTEKGDLLLGTKRGEAEAKILQEGNEKVEIAGKESNVVVLVIDLVTSEQEVIQHIAKAP